MPARPTTPVPNSIRLPGSGVGVEVQPKFGTQKASPTPRVVAPVGYRGIQGPTGVTISGVVDSADASDLVDLARLQDYRANLVVEEVGGKETRSRGDGRGCDQRSGRAIPELTGWLSSIPVEGSKYSRKSTVMFVVGVKTWPKFQSPLVNSIPVVVHSQAAVSANKAAGNSRPTARARTSSVFFIRFSLVIERVVSYRQGYRESVTNPI